MGAPKGEVNDLTEPLSIITWVCFFTSASSLAYNIYGLFAIGSVPGTRLMKNSISHMVEDLVALKKI